MKLFTYSPKKRLAAFRSGGGGGGSVGEQQQRQRYAVFVPGLTDGLLALDYVPALAAAMDRLGYSFVQPILSSSYKGAVPPHACYKPCPGQCNTRKVCFVMCIVTRYCCTFVVCRSGVYTSPVVQF